MLVVSLLGLLVVSTIIGVVTSGIKEKLDDLRRGRSIVVESGHTLIIGWSSKISSVVRELVIANANQGRSVVVILADLDKVDMKDQIATTVGSTENTRVICRSGSPTDVSNLKIVSPQTARSIIVLRDEANNSDASAIKTVLALRQWLGSPFSVPVIAEVVENTNVDAARRIDEKVLIVQPGELITRIIVQAARQSGLSHVYDEILSFEGNEIYFHSEPSFAGLPFGEVSMHFEQSVVLGLRTVSGEINLNPPASRHVRGDDSLILISEDDDTIVASEPVIQRVGLSSPSSAEALEKPESAVVLGWHRFGDILVGELTELMPSGSSITIVCDRDRISALPAVESAELGLDCAVRFGDTTSRQVLESLDLPGCDHIILLSYRDRIDPQQADNLSLLTLIHLRDICGAGSGSANIVSEIIDVRNRDLVREEGDGNDFVASEEIVSKVLVQLSENIELGQIFDELLTADGCEFYLRPASAYGPGSTATFADWSRESLTRGEIAVGYRLGGVVTLNPPKSQEVILGTRDVLIVLADD